ncbi:MAG: hypothetical protein AAFX41_00550, partial [Bacteroidota bacterium]
MPDRPSYSDEDLARFFEESQAHHGTVGAAGSQLAGGVAQPTAGAPSATDSAPPSGDGAGSSPREVR